VIRHPGAADGANPAGVVDLGGEPAAVVALAEKFVTEHPLVIHVAPSQLKVGSTDAGRSDLKLDLARFWDGLRPVASQADRRTVTNNPAHHSQDPRFNLSSQLSRTKSRPFAISPILALATNPAPL
jgi:hypothetical protein